MSRGGIRVCISPDMITEILLRLPVKSLLRFRSVSKPLCTEMDTPEFINHHMKKSIDSKIRHKLIIHRGILQKNSDFYAVDFDKGLKEADLLNCPFKSRPPTSASDLKYLFIKMYGLCNGLVYFYMIIKYPGLNYLLWNPFSRRYKKLPPCPAMRMDSSDAHYYIKATGLGYDSASDDYKVLVMMVNRYTPQEHPRFLVYSLRSNSWRWIHDEQSRTSIAFKIAKGEVAGRWAAADGALYWPCRVENGAQIVGFDVSKEVFFELPFLSGSDKHYSFTVALFDGNLYTAKLDIKSKMQEFYLWVKTEGCWRRAFAIDLYKLNLNKHDNYFAWNLQCSEKNGNEGDSKVLFTRGDRFLWYDLKSRVENNLSIERLPHSFEYFSNVCLETLVSLGDDSVYDGIVPEISDAVPSSASS